MRPEALARVASYIAAPSYKPIHILICQLIITMRITICRIAAIATITASGSQ
ncbi:MAG: hypothetical protein WCD49_09075 [Candidatus Acidiferrales bacterium]